MDTLTQSCSPYDSHKQPMVKCRRMKRPQFMSKNWVYSWLWKFSKNTPAVWSLGKLCDETRILIWMDQWSKNHISLKHCIRIQCNTENFVSIVVLVYQRVLPQACLLQHPWHLQGRKLIIPTSSSISSTSPAMTSSSVSSESVARQEREDLLREGSLSRSCVK